MNRFLLMLVLILAASGAVWAQIGINDAPDKLIDWNFNAVQTESNESRFSVQRFTSDMDTYIDPALYDPEIGTFIFVGGHPNDVTPTFTLGFGKTIGNSYLGVYYGGSLFTGVGRNEEKSPINDNITKNSSFSWNSNLALLYGIANMGFRLDLILKDAFKKTNFKDSLVWDEPTTGATSIALGWGADFGLLKPWARIGYKLPITETKTNGSDTNAPTQRMIRSEDAQVGLLAGAWYGLNDTDSLLAELNFTLQFPREYKGDTKQLMADPDIPSSVGPDPFKDGGGWAADLSASYEKSIELGNETVGITTLRFAPRVGVNFTSWAEEYVISTVPYPQLPRANWFTIGTGIDVGAEYRFQKIALYTGFCLDIIEFKTLNLSGGTKPTDPAGYEWVHSQWQISGLVWKNPLYGGTMQNPVLKFALAFTPIENLIIGAGIDFSPLEVFDLNLRNMQVSNVKTSPFVGHDGNFGVSDFQVTVSYKF